MEEKLMNKVQQIIQGISAAMANSYDGAHDENGEPVKIGLRREEGNPVIDSRVMDGFDLKLQGNLLVVKYYTEENLKGLRSIHRTGLEKYQNEIEQRMANIVKFVKKEAKKATGATVNLKLDGEIDILIQPMNKLRTMVSAVGMYTIGGMEAQEDPKPEGGRRSEADFYKSFMTNLKEEKRKKTLGYKPFWRKS
tara:strand:- start:48 stop:629 length:582 start_codon:yes stop_codon:yes gene_type:complete